MSKQQRIERTKPRAEGLGLPGCILGAGSLDLGSQIRRTSGPRVSKRRSSIAVKTDCYLRSRFGFKEYEGARLMVFKPGSHYYQ